MRRPLLSVSFLSSCLSVCAKPCCPQAKRIRRLGSWGEFKCCYKEFALYSATRLSKHIQLPDLFLPLENHLYTWVGSFTSIFLKSLAFSVILIVILFSCFMLLFKKILFQHNVSRKVETENRNPISAHSKKCACRRQRPGRFLSQQGTGLFFLHHIFGMWMLWLSHWITIRKKIAIWFLKVIFS